MKRQVFRDAPYRLDEAIALARQAEKVLEPLGFHCGVIGGCLHTGASNKDIDLVVFPHTKQAARTSTAQIDTLLYRLGAIVMAAPEFPDGKVVRITQYNNCKVDFIFLE